MPRMRLEYRWCFQAAGYRGSRIAWQYHATVVRYPRARADGDYDDGDGSYGR